MPRPLSPVLDQLAANGLKVTQGYSNSPVCSPTRFALLWARYQYRLRGALEEPINSASKGSDTLGLPTDVPTLPSLLREAGFGPSTHWTDPRDWFSVFWAPAS